MRIDPLESSHLELFPELPIHQLDRLSDGFAGRPGVGCHHPIEVVEHVQEAHDEGRLGLVGQVDPLPSYPLAEVVEFRGKPEVAVVGLGQLVLEPPDCVLGRLHGHPAGDGRLGFGRRNLRRGRGLVRPGILFERSSISHS